MQWFPSDPTDSVLVFITWVWPAGPCHVSRAGRSDAVTWRVWRVRAAWRQAAHCRRTTTGLVSAAASVSASRTRPKPLPHTVTSATPPPLLQHQQTKSTIRSAGLWANYWTGIKMVSTSIWICLIITHTTISNEKLVITSCRVIQLNRIFATTKFKLLD